MSTNVTTTKRLNAILESVANSAERDDLRNRFFIVNALEFAKQLHALDLPDATKAGLLALKVGLPPSYKGVDLSPLVDRAMDQMWSRLAEECSGLGSL